MLSLFDIPIRAAKADRRLWGGGLVAGAEFERVFKEYSTIIPRAFERLFGRAFKRILRRVLKQYS